MDVRGMRFFPYFAANNRHSSPRRLPSEHLSIHVVIAVLQHGSSASGGDDAHVALLAWPRNLPLRALARIIGHDMCEECFS